ncbi:hypothetical protein DRQ50_07945 [bacterium]|nr:MAG: hypothetical protein DRQ50_07945 [bacterium]
MQPNVHTSLERATPWLAALAVAVLYAATASVDFGGVSADTGNYVLGTVDFDPAAARPHLPGSWLLIVMLRGLAPLFGAHGALLAVAVACAAGAAGLGYRVAREYFRPGTAWLLVAAVATQPVSWFYGTVAEVYAFDLFFGVLTMWMGSSRRGLVILPLVFALGAGLRLTTPALLLPLYLWLWWRGRGWWSVRSMVVAHVVALPVLVGVMWPNFTAAGGLTAYLSLYESHLTVSWSLVRNLWGMSLFLATVAGTVLVLAVAGLRFRARGSVDHRLPVWLLPPLAFFVLGHYQKGYILLVMVPLLILSVARIAPVRRRLVLTILVILQTTWFLAAPYRAPDPDVLAAPRTRSLTWPGVWWQRVQSTHLMAAARPRALAAADADLTGILAAAPGDTLLVDPTFPLTLRALQIHHESRAFAGLEVERRDGWRLHSGLEESTGTNVAHLLARCILVTRRDFAGTGLDTSGAVVVHAGQEYIGLRLDPRRTASVAIFYDERYGRY